MTVSAHPKSNKPSPCVFGGCHNENISGVTPQCLSTLYVEVARCWSTCMKMTRLLRLLTHPSLLITETSS